MDGSERGTVKHFRSMMSNFTARTAAESSSLGMVIPFSGVRRDFPTTKAQRTEPCSSTIQRYEHAEYVSGKHLRSDAIAILLSVQILMA